MRTITLILLFLILIASPLSASHLLQSGPMVCWSEMREVALWVQTTKPAKVQFYYWSDAEPEKRLETAVKVTRKEHSCTATLIADKVKPGNRYSYELLINSNKVDIQYPLQFQSQQLWQWRSDPPDFNFAMGSSTYINERAFDRPGEYYADELTFNDPYGQNSSIFTTINHMQPDFMMWMGDNVYLRESDWDSRTGIFQRYTHTRSTQELQPLLGSVHHYAIWDDHDYGPDNSDRSFQHKGKSLETFKLFFPSNNFGVNGNPGTTSKFSWADVDFFLLDNRYYRSPNNRRTGKKEILGEEQIEWLIDGLVFSEASFKIVVIGGQFLNPATVGENHANYPEERSRILHLIEQEDIKSVLFLTGDRHFTELSKLERENSYPLYEFTISPLTAKPTNIEKVELNPLRVDGTLTTINNFALMTVSGSRNDRKLSCSVRDAAGADLWNYSINENELK